MQDKNKNRESETLEEKQMGSQDAKQKNGETRRKTKKNWGDQMSDKTSSFEPRCLQRKGLRLNCRERFSDLVRFVRIAGLDLSDFSNLPFLAILKKRETDQPTDRQTDRPSYRDA